MRPTLPLVLALLLVTLALPTAPADAIVTGGTAYVNTAWSWNGLGGSCRETLAISTQHVNTRLLVEVKTSTRKIGGSTGLPDSQCALDLAITPGLYVNPCQVLKGEVPSPAVSAVDPYFYPYANHWRKVVTFADGGYVDYRVYPWYDYGAGMGGFEGWCGSGSATGWWSGEVGVPIVPPRFCVAYWPAPVCVPPA